MYFDNIEKILNNDPDSKIALFVRHAEKNHEGEVYLTHKGINDALAFARKLQSLNINVRIFSSPEPRCAQTADIINSQLKIPCDQISFSNSLGKPGLQIFDNELYEKLYAKLKCREIFHQWKNGQHYNSLRNPKILRTLAYEFIRTTCTEKGVTLYISQSGTVASIGYALDLINYDVTTGEWVDFLEGFLIPISADSFIDPH